jgi:hypothetical protein
MALSSGLPVLGPFFRKATHHGISSCIPKALTRSRRELQCKTVSYGNAATFDARRRTCYSTLCTWVWEASLLPLGIANLAQEQLQCAAGER